MRYHLGNKAKLIILSAAVAAGGGLLWAAADYYDLDIGLTRQADVRLRKSVSEKVEIERRLDAERESAESWTRGRPRQAEPLPEVEPGSPVKTGIFEEAEGPWPADWFRTENLWMGYVGQSITNVYAGASPGEPLQGKLVITSQDQKRAFDVYLTPNQTGPIRIESVEGTVLELRSTGGERYLFDVAARKFLER